MSQELENFSFEVNEIWENLPKNEILINIEKHINNSRSKISCDHFDLKNEFGIYAFFIKPTIPFLDAQQLQIIWNEEGFKNFPQIVKKRFEKQKCCNDGWFNLYLGKGEKLKKRIEEHLYHHSKHATYGLKLKERKVFLAENDIEVGYWHLPSMPNVPREIKQFIITNMESSLRDKMQPWIGKQ